MFVFVINPAQQLDALRFALPTSQTSTYANLKLKSFRLRLAPSHAQLASYSLCDKSRKQLLLKCYENHRRGLRKTGSYC